MLVRAAGRASLGAGQGLLGSASDPFFPGLRGLRGVIPCLGVPEQRLRQGWWHRRPRSGACGCHWSPLEVGRLLAWWPSVELERSLTLTGHLLCVRPRGSVTVPFPDEAQRGQCLAQGHTARDEAGRCAEPIGCSRAVLQRSALWSLNGPSGQRCPPGGGISEAHPLQGPLRATQESELRLGRLCGQRAASWEPSAPAVSPSRSQGAQRGSGHLAPGTVMGAGYLPGPRRNLPVAAPEDQGLAWRRGPWGEGVGSCSPPLLSLLL